MTGVASNCALFEARSFKQSSVRRSVADSVGKVSGAETRILGHFRGTYFLDPEYF